MKQSQSLALGAGWRYAIQTAFESSFGQPLIFRRWGADSVRDRDGSLFRPTECPVHGNIFRATIADPAGRALTQHEDEPMLIRTTTDPITLRDVPNPESHPHLLDGNGQDGLLIYFESEDTRHAYEDIELEDYKIFMGDASEDYVAEG
jgi:hypothetical protein